MNLLPATWRVIKTDPHITELKGKHHRLSHQSGLMELSFNLTPAQRDQFEARSKELRATRELTIATVSTKASDAIKAAKREAELATDQAHRDYESAVFALFIEYGKLPTREQIATSETEVGDVVHAPAEPELQLGAAAKA